MKLLHRRNYCTSLLCPWAKRTGPEEPEELVTGKKKKSMLTGISLSNGKQQIILFANS